MQAMRFTLARSRATLAIGLFAVAGCGGAKDPEADIRAAWVLFLDSVAGNYSQAACSPSRYWVPSEQQQWPCYALASLYLPDDAKPEIVGITAADRGEYRVVTRFDSDSASSPLRSGTATMTVFAVRADGQWLFANALPRLTQAWTRDTVGAVVYVFGPGYPYDRARAERAVAFTDSIAGAFGVPPIERLTYYLTSSVDEVYRIMGLETPIKWGPVGGVAQPVNHQLFSGIPGVGEDYRHELAHVVLSQAVGRSLYFWSEGVATWLGGTTGLDFPSAAATFGKFLSQNPTVSLDAIMAGRSPPAQLYPAGAVLALMVHERGGAEAIKRLGSAGTAANFRAAAESVFGQPWNAIAEEWHKRALEFADGNRSHR